MPFSSFNANANQVDEGRIVVDAKLFHEQDPDNKPRIRPLGSEIKEKEKTDNDNEYYNRAVSADDDEEYNDNYAKPGRLTLNEDEYCYCIAFVKGYNLTSKQWGEYSVHRVNCITNNKQLLSKPRM